MAGFVEKSATSPTMAGVVAHSKDERFKAQVLLSSADYNWRGKVCERFVLLVFVFVRNFKWDL